MGDCKGASGVKHWMKGNFFQTTSDFCTNEPVVLARGNGKYSHDIRVEVTNSICLNPDLYPVV